MGTTRASRAILAWLESGSPDEPHTQEVLAQRLGKLVNRPVSQSTVSLIARGLQQPRADLVSAFRAVLDIDVDLWLPDAPASTPALPVDDTETDAA